MNSVRALLLEALLLRVKYTDSDFRTVCQALSRPEDESLKEFLTLVQALPLSKAKSATRQRAKDLLASIQDSDPSRYNALARLRERLLSRALLPTAGELRAFERWLGMEDVPKRKREQTVNAIIRFLMEVPTEVVQEAERRASSSSLSEDKSYAELADTILRRNKE